MHGVFGRCLRHFCSDFKINFTLEFNKYFFVGQPRAGSGIIRIDPLCFQWRRKQFASGSTMPARSAGRKFFHVPPHFSLVPPPFTLPYHTGQTFYRLTLRPLTGPMRIPELTVRLQHPQVQYSLGSHTPYQNVEPHSQVRAYSL